MRRHTLKIAVVVACTLALAACGDDDGRDGTSTTVPASSDTTTAPSDRVVDPERVLLAATILEFGDIDAALAEGLVTPDDVDEAIEAVDDGTIEEWVDRAESP